MHIFIAVVNDFVVEDGYTNLKGLCKRVGVNYSSATRGKKIYIVQDDVIKLYKIKIHKIKGRDHNTKLKQP